MKRRTTSIEKLESLPTSAAILDARGEIVAVNDAWIEFGRRNGLRVAHSAVGSNYLQYCRSKDPALRRFIRELRALLAGKLDLLTFIYPCHSATEQRWFSLIGIKLSPDKRAGVALLHVNLTDMLPVARIGKREAVTGKRAQIHLDVDLKAIGDVVEHSVAETLSSQMNSLVARNLKRPASKKSVTHQGEFDRALSMRDRLTRRQQEILRLLGESKTNKEMAKELFVSPNTIKLHVSAILKSLEMRSRTQAALLSSDLKKQDWAKFDADRKVG